MTANNLIAFQGEHGSNSNIACEEVFPTWQTLPCATFEDALSAVRDKRTACAMIAIENTVAGRVADVHHLLPKSGLHIVGEHFLPIHHFLMALPGASMDRLDTVHSHVHALGQCRNFIQKHKLRAIVAGDTAGSAREVRLSGDLRRASIAPKLAAEIHGLSILAECIEDEAHNTTRFVILAREPVMPDRSSECMTTVLFKVRNLPAALYKTLGGFATNKLNLTRIESYMVGGRFENTQFLVDVAAHVEDAGFILALEELSYYASEIQVLGCYPAHPHRRSASQLNENASHFNAG